MKNDRLSFQQSNINTILCRSEASIKSYGLVAEPDKVLVGELNKWVANPLGPGQTSALHIKTRSA